MRYTVLLTLAALFAGSANATVFYSGIENRSLTATDSGTIYTTTIDLRYLFFDRWDDLELTIYYFTNRISGSSQNRFGSRASLAFDPVTGFFVNYAQGEAITGEYDEEEHDFFRWENGAGFSGEFVNTTGYAGLRMTDDNGDTLYGWVQIAVSGLDPDADTGPTITLIDWAHSTIPGQRIAAGVVPLPPTLLLLAPSLAIVLLRRRRLSVSGAGRVI